MNRIEFESSDGAKQVQVVRFIFKVICVGYLPLSTIIVKSLPAATSAHVFAPYSSMLKVRNLLCSGSFMIFLQSLANSLAPRAVVIIIVVVVVAIVAVAIVAVVLSHTSVATASTIVGLKVLKPQPSRLPVDTSSWTSAASPPAISRRILPALRWAVALVFPCIYIELRFLPWNWRWYSHAGR